MAVETATKISELNINWPLGTDAKSEGDDHLRLIKKVLKATDGGALTGISVSVKTSSGTWTKPAGLKFLAVEAIGAGGGGGSAGITAAGQMTVGAGGGGGGYARKLYAAAALAASVAYTVGAPGQPQGTGDFDGTAGGSSGFASLTGGGGQGGAGSDAPTTSLSTQLGGGGGNASGGDINVLGQSGWYGNTFVSGLLFSSGGAGGSSALGTGGRVLSLNQPGYAGSGFGGGGSGGGNGPSSAAVKAGAVGAAGCIILTEYF